MAHNYVKKMYNLSTTNATTVYTVPSEKTAFLNSFRYSETSNNATTLTITITDSSANVFSFITTGAASALAEADVLTRNLILNEGDIIKGTAADANRLTLHLSILERDQGVNNKFIAKRNDYTTTDTVTVYTVPTAKKAIVSSIIIANDDTSNATGTNYVKFNNSSDTAFTYLGGTVAAGLAFEGCARPQVMDESEYITFHPGSANDLHSHFSILEIGNPG